MAGLPDLWRAWAPFAQHSRIENPMTDPRVEEIRARLAAAAKMPWVAQTSLHDDGLPPFTLYHTDEYDDPSDPFGLIQTEGDAEFIAHAPTDINYLLTKLDAVEREMHSRELHHCESEELLEAAEERERTLLHGVTKLISDLDSGRSNGAIYTYGHIQSRLSRLLPSTPTEEGNADD